MSRKENAALAGVAVVACAACCAGPVVGVLAAIGLGTAAGVALWGAGALLVGLVAAAIFVARRRRAASRAQCSGTTDGASVAVAVPVAIAPTHR